MGIFTGPEGRYAWTWDAGVDRGREVDALGTRARAAGEPPVRFAVSTPRSEGEREETLA